MKGSTRRPISLLLAFVMVVGLLSGITMPAQARDIDYNKDGSYIYNWGARGELATFLSDNALDFYTDNTVANVTYAELSQLSGSASADMAVVAESPLYTKLQTLMASNHTTYPSYSSSANLFTYTDCENGGLVTTRFSTFYSGELWHWGSTLNREHTWPASKIDNSTEADDFIKLRPTVASLNQGRGNTAYGESSGFFYPNISSSVDVRGDVARLMLYGFVRWGNTTRFLGSSGVIESLDVLFDWMVDDPVDTWELGRNDSVESITGTRNVFVDYPELAFLLFGRSVPSDYNTPSGEAWQASYTVSATSGNADWGSVEVNGNHITAFPAEGYKATGCAVTSGTATVTQAGNIFTVSASADCTVQITFEARSAVTVAFSQDGTVVSTEKLYAGDQIELPAFSGAEPEGLGFCGWTTDAVYNTQAEPDYDPVETIFTIPENASGTLTLYALFTASSNPWVLVENVSQLAAGKEVVLAANTKGAVAGGISGKYLTSVSATFSSDYSTITSLPDSAVILTLGGSTGSWTLTNPSGQKLGASAAGTVAFGRGTTTWKITVSGGNATIQNGTSSYGSFRYNASSPRFNTYTSSPTSNMLLPQLYIRSAGGDTVIYTTGTTAPEGIPGDINRDGLVTRDDVVKLLLHVTAPTAFTIDVPADFTGDGKVTRDDVVKLLLYVTAPGTFPLQ